MSFLLFLSLHPSTSFSCDDSIYLENPCVPSPCGPHSNCREVNSHAVCSCVSNYFGAPPNCRPECVVSSECSADKACVNQRCVDPCPGTCGLYARCQVVNHNAICSCQSGYVGDPFVRCVSQPSKQFLSFSLNLISDTVHHYPPFFSHYLEPVVHDPVYPCTPSPCGPNSVCRAIGDVPVCGCVENYIGQPPNCRPECTSDSECPSIHSCINEKCRDPCAGSCGFSALCSVVNHRPMCRCPEGYTGDPFSGCSAIPTSYTPPEIPMPCNPSPCGINAVCKERGGAGSCLCLSEYHGDPYVECRPECVLNSDCSKTKACVNNKCVDPCPGVCGINAECHANNHIPICNCLNGYTGNPSAMCHAVVHGKLVFTFFKPTTPIIYFILPLDDPIPQNPCRPSPCGPFSECRDNNGYAICSCLNNYIGSPPSCRPECSVSTDCAPDKACVNRKCTDPCPGTCGQKARCHVTKHSPICSCPPGHSGDPFVRCFVYESMFSLDSFNTLTSPTYNNDDFLLEPPVFDDTPQNPCVPSPCGRNSVCREVNGAPSCSCLPNYIGRAPNCRPECSSNSECPSNLACFNEKCRDPCPGSCGFSAQCTVVNHTPSCTCISGFTGDPFTACNEMPRKIKSSISTENKICINLNSYKQPLFMTKSLAPAILPRAVQMLFVRSAMALDRAHAWQNILAIHIQDADRNARLTTIVPATRLA